MPDDDDLLEVAEYVYSELIENRAEDVQEVDIGLVNDAAKKAIDELGLEYHSSDVLHLLEYLGCFQRRGRVFIYQD